jgi:ligand-binding SRPBCC domain-containing protein
MPAINLKTVIKAPVSVCFDAARNIDLHVQSMQRHQEQAIAGVTQGLIGLNQTVTWRAWHFGFPFKLKVKVTEMQLHEFFVDQMVSGPFKWFRHYHAFEPHQEGTVMVDEFVFKSPLGWLGKLVDRWVLKEYLQTLLLQRNQLIKQTAEAQSVILLNLYPHENAY